MVSIEEVQNADYSTLVGWVNERNRPSGGVRTLAEFAVKGFLSPSKKVLEVGSNTGFSVVNLAALTGAHCTGVDVNSLSVKESFKYAEQMGVKDLTDFKEGDALNIPFENNSFDALWVSNVTSFIDDKNQAFKEYFRVLKPNGILGVAPIYYLKTPPKDLFKKVEEYVGAKVNIQNLEGWRTEIFQAADIVGANIVEYACKNYQYLDTQDNIQEWISGILKKPHLLDWEEDAKQALMDRYKESMMVFNENLKYCGFSLLMYQKRQTAEEQELFLTKEVL